jgi:alpha-galactosidase
MKYFSIFAATLIALNNSATSFAQSPDSSFANLMRPPDVVTAVTETSTATLAYSGKVFSDGGVEVRTLRTNKGLGVSISAPGVPVKYVQLRWQGKMPVDGWRYLGDAWERAYGDLEWKPLDAKRVMPWYFLVSNGKQTHGYGVMTGPSAMCDWKADADGITLSLDLRNGGRGVLLGSRRLSACTIVVRTGKTGETPFAATQAFCRQMCPHPRMPKEPVYGFNDWYCDYGKSSAASIMDYARYVVNLSPKSRNRPFMVIDDGWQPAAAGDGGGTGWDCGNANFPSMPQLAADIKKTGARPGIWVRLLFDPSKPNAWKLRGTKEILDPSVPEVRSHVKQCVARFRDWGFELIKHDFSTIDITANGWKTAVVGAVATWQFADRSRTTAEIITDFYRDIREAAGDKVLVLGCNTVGHLSAGLVELSRIGDDTSGKDWSRTRKMGVNSLAFRGPQHGTFFAADADCVGLTAAEEIPWKYNCQWLDLLSRSGTPLFISFKKGALTADQEKQVAAALELAAKQQPLAEPLDWFTTLQPCKWRLMGEERNYNWGNQP